LRGFQSINQKLSKRSKSTPEFDLNNSSKPLKMLVFALVLWYNMYNVNQQRNG